jgi:hypothetical protein
MLEKAEEGGVGGEEEYDNAFICICFFNYATDCNHAKTDVANATSPGILDTV